MATTMGQSQVSTKPMGTCEKIHKAVAKICPLRSIHRHHSPPGIPVSEDGELSPNHPRGRTTGSPSKTHFFLRKLVAPYKAHPGQLNVPIEPGPLVFDQRKNGRVIMINNPTTHPGDQSTAKREKTGIQAQSQATKPATAAVISQSENLKTTIASELPKVSLNKEAKPPGVSAGEKSKKKTESKIPPSNVIVIQGPGQGMNNAISVPKVQSTAKPNMPAQGVQSKPRSQPAASAEKVTANQDQKINDHSHKYSAYIDHVKNQLRTKSNVGEETSTEMPPTKIPAKRDSFNDKVSNFITRAQKNIKMPHSGDW